MNRWGEPDPKGYDTHRLGDIDGVTYESIDVDLDPSELDRLSAYLGEGAWVVAEVKNGPMTVFARNHDPELVSHHGPMVTSVSDSRALMESLGAAKFGFHVIVLIEYSAERLSFFDPYHEATHQPLQMSEEQLVLMSTGRFWIAKASE